MTTLTDRLKRALAFKGNHITDNLNGFTDPVDATIGATIEAQRLSPLHAALCEVVESLYEIKEGVVPGVAMPCKLGPRQVSDIANETLTKLTEILDEMEEDRG